MERTMQIHFKIVALSLMLLSSIAFAQDNGSPQTRPSSEPHYLSQNDNTGTSSPASLSKEDKMKLLAAVDAFEQGDYQNALPTFRSFAALNEPMAQYLLSLIHI